MSAPLPSVSVVVPAYDAARTIGACVDSLLALTYPPDLLEVIVVDNGSRDGTPGLLARYPGEVVTVLAEPRRGRSAARNAGIRHARGDVVAFTDADCTVTPGWLDSLVGCLREPGVGIAGGSVRARRPATGAELFGEAIHDQHMSILVWRPPYVTTANWASRRKVLEEAGLFDEGLRACEDVDLSYRIGRAGYDLVYCEDAVVFHANEPSLLGLCRLGWRHGFHAVPVLARHADYVAAARLHPGLEPASPVRPLPARYARAFGAGKRAGRAMGRARLSLTRSRLPAGSRA